MKKLIFTVVALLSLAAGVQAADRIVFVDLERIFNNFYKTQLAKSKMEVQRSEIQTERQVMVDEIAGISKEVDTLKQEARDTTLVEEVRTSKRVLFEDRLIELKKKQQDIEEFTKLREKQLTMQITRMSQNLMDEIRQTVISYAQTEGLQAVVDSSARKAAVGVFMYIHPDVDITEEILNDLNSKRPAELDATPDTEDSQQEG